MTSESRRMTGRPTEALYLDLGFELPTIDISLLNRTDVPATGAGETAITVVPAAIGNAIFNAAGVRLREVPFTTERVRAALSGL